jgi:hypothetical protein
MCETGPEHIWLFTLFTKDNVLYVKMKDTVKKSSFILQITSERYIIRTDLTVSLMSRIKFCKSDDILSLNVKFTVAIATIKA